MEKLPDAMQEGAARAALLQILTKHFHAKAAEQTYVPAAAKARRLPAATPATNTAAFTP